MKAAGLAAMAAIGILSIGLGAQPRVLKIVSPADGAVVSGSGRLEATVAAAAAGDAVPVQKVSFFVNGRLVCTAEQAPYRCPWDPGAVVRAYHVRVVATLADGRRLVDNVRTRDLGYTEQVRADAVLVPAIVTANGQFVRGLKQQDFQVYEDGVSQAIASLVTEDAPLDLVLAVDISGSMEGSLERVKPAVKQLLSMLRRGDAATLVGFNDTTFIVAEREQDQAARERAVELLTPWGGTAFYDATVRALDLVSREWGRKGVVLFSDGDDRDSMTSRASALARVQASDAMLYTIGFGAGATVPRLRSSLEEYARATGGRASFPQQVQELDGIFTQIIAELSNQYILSYSPINPKQDGRWRNIKVRVRKGNYDVRARQGYFARGLQKAGR